jgi:hypothetical protein
MNLRLARFHHAPMILLGGLYLYAAARNAAHAPLWHDEIVTFYVAGLDGPRAIVEALLAKADNHPPVDYLARYLSLAFLGENALAFRLPSILGLLVAAVCLYCIVLRWASVPAAIVAFSLPLGTVALDFAYEGRPYSLLLASMALAFLAWQRAAEKPSAIRLALLALALALGPFVHYYGVFNFLPIAAGEAWRSWENRKFCWPIVLSGTLAVALIGFLVPFVLSASEFAAHFWSPLSPTAPFKAYYWLVGTTMPAFIACLILFSAAAIFRPAGSAAAESLRRVPTYELVAAFVVSLLPFTTYILATLVTHAYAARYMLNTTIGIALLLAFMTLRLQRIHPLYGVVIALSFGLWSTAAILDSARKAPPQPYALPAHVVQAIEEAALPVVVPNFNRYLMTHFYLPANLKNRIYYPIHRTAGPRSVDSDTIERVFLNLQPFVPLNLPTFCEFAAQHRQFLILPGGKGWLYEKLATNGATINVVSGRFPDDAELLVTLNRASDC